MKGNQNAAKPPQERADSHLHLRVRSRDKALWEACARREGVPLTQWVLYFLNEASRTG